MPFSQSKNSYIIKLQALPFVYHWSCKLFTAFVHPYASCQSRSGNLYVVSVNTTQYGVRSLKFASLWYPLIFSNNIGRRPVLTYMTPDY